MVKLELSCAVGFRFTLSIYACSLVKPTKGAPDAATSDGIELSAIDPRRS